MVKNEWQSTMAISKMTVDMDLARWFGPLVDDMMDSSNTISDMDKAR